MSKHPLIDDSTEEQVIGEIASSSTVDAEETLRAIDQFGLTRDLFTNDDRRRWFDLAVEELRKGRPAALLALEPEMRRRGIPVSVASPAIEARGLGGAMFLAKPIEHLRDLKRRRDLASLARELNLRAADFTESPDDTQGFLARSINDLVRGGGSRARRLSEKMPLVAQELAAVGSGKSRVLKTGIGLWDQNVGGLHPTLTVIGGHPSRGKSGLAASMIWRLAERGHRPGVFTLEDTADAMIYRYLAAQSRVSSFFMRTRPMSADQQEAIGQVWEHVRTITDRVYFDERSRPTPAQVLAAAREMVLSNDVDVVFLDHLGELSFESKRGGERTDLDIKDGLLDLRALAKDTGVPLVVLSHLKRGTKAPHQMEDFAEAAAVERAARVAAIIWTADGKPLDPLVSIVKNTLGKRDFDLRFRLDPISALVDEPPDQPSPKKEQEDMFS